MRPQSQRGGALVEFAMIAPFMCMLFFGAIQFGYAIFVYHSVDYGARIGSRWAAVRGGACTNTSVCPTTSAAVQTYVQNTVPGLQGATVTATWTAPPSAWNNQPGGTCGSSSETPGCIVEVNVTKTLPFIVPFVKSTNINLTSTSQAIIQQ